MEYYYNKNLTFVKFLGHYNMPANKGEGDTILFSVLTFLEDPILALQPCLLESMTAHHCTRIENVIQYQ